MPIAVHAAPSESCVLICENSVGRTAANSNIDAGTKVSVSNEYEYSKEANARNMLDGLLIKCFIAMRRPSRRKTR